MINDEGKDNGKCNSSERNNENPCIIFFFFEEHLNINRCSSLIKHTT
jgi:hypothetical protein